MAINFGSNAISGIRLGSTEVAKVYLGSNEIWPVVTTDPTIFVPTATSITSIGRPSLERSNYTLFNTFNDLGTLHPSEIYFSFFRDNAPEIGTGITGGGTRKYIRRLHMRALQAPTNPNPGIAFRVWIATTLTGLAPTTPLGLGADWTAHPFFQFQTGSNTWTFPISTSNIMVLNQSDMTPLQRTNWETFYETILPFSSIDAFPGHEYIPRRDISIGFVR